jgi:N-methylhydantoinase A
VTDAHLVLGRIPPSLLDGEIRLDRAAAEHAIQACIANPLGLSLEAAAEAFWRSSTPTWPAPCVS